jgi:hypothetical protein
VRAVLAHLDDLIASVWAAAQLLHGAIRGLLPHAGDQEARGRGEIVNPQKTEKSQVKLTLSSP